MFPFFFGPRFGFYLKKTKFFSSLLVRTKESSCLFPYIFLLDRFVPFGVKGIVLEPIPAVYGRRQSRRWIDHSVYLGFWYIAQEVLRVLAFLPATLSCRLCSLKPCFIVHSSSQKWKIVKREWGLKHESWHLFSPLFAVIHIVWSIYSSPPSCQITWQMLRKEQYKWGIFLPGFLCW